jgi:TatD DNase family protein
VPLEWLLIETDAPYLTPEPYRGKRNESSYVRFVAEKIAEIKGLPVEKIAEITSMNARRLFSLPQIS